MKKYLNTDNDTTYTELEMIQEYNKQMEIDKQNGNFSGESYKQWKDSVCSHNGVFEEIKE